MALDRTKLKANASRHKVVSYGRMVRAEAELEAEVQRIQAEAEAIDTAEDAEFDDARGDERPSELARRETRLAKIREAKTALEAAARERTGDPDAVPEPKAQRNFTDPELRIMRAPSEGFVQSQTRCSGTQSSRGAFSAMLKLIRLYEREVAEC